MVFITPFFALKDIVVVGDLNEQIKHSTLGMTTTITTTTIKVTAPDSNAFFAKFWSLMSVSGQNKPLVQKVDWIQVRRFRKNPHSQFRYNE